LRGQNETILKGLSTILDDNNALSSSFAVQSSKPKGVRMGYMGHLTLISEDVISALEHFPPDLRLIVAQHAPQPEWDEYVSGRYKETKKKDSSLLGGGKPVVAPGMRGSAGSWKVDEADAGAAATSMPQEAGGDEGLQGEFRRNVRPVREGSADFSAAPMEEDDDEFHNGPSHVSASLLAAR
jgi:serine/threonine-protein phosphatase 6 regulatory subunit 3